jgi:hypothetical protein
MSTGELSSDKVEEHENIESSEWQYYVAREFGESGSVRYYRLRYNDEIKFAEGFVDVGKLYSYFQKMCVDDRITVEQALQWVEENDFVVKGSDFEYFLNMFADGQGIRRGCLKMALVEAARVSFQSSLFDAQLGLLGIMNKNALGLLKDLAPDCSEEELAKFVSIKKRSLCVKISFTEYAMMMCRGF